MHCGIVFKSVRDLSLWTTFGGEMALKKYMLHSLITILALMQFVQETTIKNILKTVLCNVIKHQNYRRLISISVVN